MPDFPIYIVDAFTDVPFRGNPAAVCLVGCQNLPNETLQKIAAEMNLSETAFLKLEQSDHSYSTASHFNLRWFTPETEVDLCGHATLASAAVVFKCCANQSETLTFDTHSGLLLASRTRDVYANDVISLDFPLNEPEPVLATDVKIANIVEFTLGSSVLKSTTSPPPPPISTTATTTSPPTPPTTTTATSTTTSPSTPPTTTATSTTSPPTPPTTATPTSTTPPSTSPPTPSTKILDLQLSPTTRKLVIRLSDDDDPPSLLQSILPDFKKLRQVDCERVKGVIVTLKKKESKQLNTSNDPTLATSVDGGFDFYSRYFAPWMGIDEDPVTGSAHTVLAPYWSKILGKKVMKAQQCSKRSGVVWVDVQNDARCQLKGNIAVVLKGVISV